MVGSPAPVNRLRARTCQPGKLSRAAPASKVALAWPPRAQDSRRTSTWL